MRNPVCCRPMRISVIMSAYNRPEFVELVLRGYALQTEQPFEIVIADDGSGPAVRAVLERFAAQTTVPVMHVRHADQGFRKTVILNRAVLAARGDYLLFTDSDCIPRRNLIAVHRKLARPRQFVSGGSLKLPAHVSQKISMAAVTDGSFAKLGWLVRQGWKPGHRFLRLLPSQAAASLLDKLTPTPALFQGNNASVWRDVVLEVNGFDNDMVYGSEDTIVGYRMLNAGCQVLQARHRAGNLHLHHGRSYRDVVAHAENLQRVNRVRRSGETRAPSGIRELPEDASLTVDVV